MTPAVAATPAAFPEPIIRALVGRVILADPDPVHRAPIERSLSAMVATTVTTVETRAELEQALGREDADLVVTTSRLGAESALQVLARARAAGDRTPFVVYSSFHDSLMRVLVSEAEGTLLSSRVVTLPDLAETAAMLVERRRDA
jgi:DNA-binding NarL/FixJ family response regulator